MKKINVLFVCMGNICRSPTAEAIFKQLVMDQGLDGAIQIESAGTHAYHVGHPPDKRSREAAVARGYSMDGFVARRVEPDDFKDFDFILAADHDNLKSLRVIQPVQQNCVVDLMSRYSSNYVGKVVPDPYYGGSKGFENVLDMLEDSSHGLLTHIRARYQV